MLNLNSFLNECCFKGCNMGLNVQKNKKDSPVHRTPGSLDSPVHRTPGSLDSPVHRTLGSFDSPVLRTVLDHQKINYCDSLVHRTHGSLDFPVHRTPGSLDSPVHRTPGTHFKMPITQPIGKKNQNGPRTCLMGPGGVVWGKKPNTKNRVRVRLSL